MAPTKDIPDTLRDMAWKGSIAILFKDMGCEAYVKTKASNELPKSIKCI